MNDKKIKPFATKKSILDGLKVPSIEGIESEKIPTIIFGSFESAYTHESKIRSVTGELLPKCQGFVDYMTGDSDCRFGTIIECDECKYGAGKKNPAAKCNQL